MSGHSKWSNIKRTKGVKDIKKSAVFTKLSKDIILAARLGNSGDVNSNPILRVAVAKAKAANMTNDKIEKAINTGMGVAKDIEESVEKTYEVLGPNGFGMLIDCDTDNANRTLTELKIVLFKNDFKLVSEGSISWKFVEKGEIILKMLNESKIEDIMLEMLDIEGIEDVSRDEEFARILTAKEKLKYVMDKLNESFAKEFELDTIGLIKKNNNPDEVELSQEQKDTIQNVIDGVEDFPEVASVWKTQEL